MFLDLVNQGCIALLVAAGTYLLYVNFRTVFLPGKTGTIVSIGGGSCAVGCGSCGISRFADGKASMPVEVRLDDGEVVRAETSPCCVCMDRMDVGSRVGITEVGSRMIAYRIGTMATGLRRMLG
ncbi:MAG: hypothetical protein ABIH11_00315 [Candidatus Altiarchaeota archaeon]